MTTYVSIIDENDAPLLAGYAYDKGISPSQAAAGLAAYNANLAQQGANYKYVDANLDSERWQSGSGI